MKAVEAVRRLIQGLALGYLAFFATVWGWIVSQTWNAPSGDPMGLSDPVLIVAGFLTASVGAGLAAVFGIEMQHARRYHPDATLGRAFTSAGSDRLLVTGVVVYALVGVAVLGIWLVRPATAPDLVKVFAMGFAGWFAGVFAAVVRAGSSRP